MFIEKVNQFISLAIENSNLEKSEFSPLRGKYISIILSNTSTVINLTIVENTFILIEDTGVESDLILEGSPIGFLNYINNIGEDHSIKISGKAALAENFSSIMSKINVDWEQIISEYTSDSVGFYSAKIYNFFNHKKIEIEESLVRNIKEYVRDETDIIPSKESINNYIKDVDSLRNKIELVDAKLKKIK